VSLHPFVNTESSFEYERYDICLVEEK